MNRAWSLPLADRTLVGRERIRLIAPKIGALSLGTSTLSRTLDSVNRRRGKSAVASVVSSTNRLQFVTLNVELCEVCVQHCGGKSSRAGPFAAAVTCNSRS